MSMQILHACDTRKSISWRSSELYATVLAEKHGVDDSSEGLGETHENHEAVLLWDVDEYPDSDICKKWNFSYK